MPELAFKEMNTSNSSEEGYRLRSPGLLIPDTSYFEGVLNRTPNLAALGKRYPSSSGDRTRPRFDTHITGYQHYDLTQTTGISTAMDVDPSRSNRVLKRISLES